MTNASEFDFEEFDISPASANTGAEFDIEEPEKVNVFSQESGKMLSVPKDMPDNQVSFLDKRQNLDVPNYSFAGFVDIGYDYVKSALSGVVSMFSTSGAELYGGYLMKRGAGVSETLERPFKTSDLASFIPIFGDETVRDATLYRALHSRSSELQYASTMKKIYSAGQDVVKSNEEWINNNLYMPETAGQQVVFDIGAMTASIASSIGLAVVTKNPAASAVLFGKLQQSSAYIEAKEKGWEYADARNLSNIMGIAEGGLEAIGVSYFFKAASLSTPLRRILFRAAEEGLQEGSQQTAEEVLAQGTGLRRTDLEGGVGRVLYSMALGSLGGGSVSSVMEIGKKVSKQEKVNIDIEKTAQNIVNSSEQIEEEFANIMRDEVNPVRYDNEKATTEAAKVVNDFLAGKDIDLTKISGQDKELAIEILGETNVDKRLKEIQAQEGVGFIPVPRQPQTFAKFLKKQGGIKIVDGESRRFSKKETPQLGGVATRNGKLSWDDAVELAVQNGFMRDSGEEAGVVPVRTRDDVIELLERESEGIPTYAENDQSLATERDFIISFNEDVARSNAEIVEGMKSIRSLQAAFKEGVSKGAKDIKAVQSNLINSLNKTSLLPADKAKFIKTIKNIQTQEQLSSKIDSIQNRVVELIDAETKRRLRDRIKKVASSIKKSKSVSADTIGMVRMMEDRFRRQGILTGYDIEKDDGYSGSRPATLRELSVEDLKSALLDIAALKVRGQAKLEILKQLKERRNADRLALLSRGTQKLSDIDMKKASIGEKLDVMDRFRNSFIALRNKANRAKLFKNPMDVMFDLLDGSKDYTGANFNVFKKRLDKAFHAHLQMDYDYTKEVIDYVKEKNISKERREMIGVWAAMQQTDGEEKLLHTGLSKYDIEMVRDRYEGDLTEDAEQELDLYEIMRGKLDALRPFVRDTMLVVYNKNMGKVTNYFPFLTDFGKMTDVEIQNRFGEDAFQIGDPKKEFNRKDVSKPFTKKREGGRQKIKIDALDVFTTHVSNATYLVQMGQDIKELGEVAASDTYLAAAGDLGQEIVVDWINLLARRGRTGNESRLLDSLRVNVGAAYLAFKVSSFAIQPTALADGASLIGGDYVSRGVKNIAVEKDWRVFVHDNMPEIRKRIGDDPAYAEMGGDTALGKAREAGFWALKRLDWLAASSVASGAYVKYMEDNGLNVDLKNPNADAIEYAQLMVRRTQSSPYAKDQPLLTSVGKMTGYSSFDKLFFQFQSFLFNRWSLIEHDMVRLGFKKGRTKKAVNIAAFLILANVAEYAIRSGVKDIIDILTGYEPPEDEKSVQEKVALQAISNVPYVSSFVSSAEYGSTPAAAMGLLESSFESLQYGSSSKDVEKKIKHYGNAALTFSGLLGVPGVIQSKQLFNKSMQEDKRDEKTGLSR